jgi:tetratricopeptide (TPR) repeat protein/L-ascorbate metabolism protein UlaG (beta-lactamase superfamily)
MNREKIIEEFKNAYLNEYKNIYKNEERIAFFEKQLSKAKETEIEEFILFYSASVEYFKENYKPAIESFNKSLELNANFAYSWHGLGNIYYDQKEYEKAITAYQKAIELDDKFIYPLNGLGNVYYAQKEYEKAFKAYQKAIEIDDKNVNSWHGLGNIYYMQKDYEKAMNAYQKAIQLDDKSPYLYFNLGLVYENKNELKTSKIHFINALEYFEKEKDKYWSSLAEKNIERINNELRVEDELKKAEKKHNVDPITEVLNRTKEYEQKIFYKQKTFLNFFDQKPNKKDERIYLKVLRRWNSYTPIIADNFHISKGGGYFLKINGSGIVIDPGFNFIDNFKGSGYKFDEIDYVIISHAHNDHTSDLESIITLLNKCNSKRKGLKDYTSQDTTRADIAKNKKCSLDNITNNEIETEFVNSERRKKIGIYLTKSTNKKYIGMLELHSKNDYECHPIETGDKKEIKDSNDKHVVSFDVIKAKHDDVISDKDSVGFVFHFDNSILVYTGDTGWSEDIEKQYKIIKEECKEQEIILLAHLGGFKEYEKNYMIEEERQNSYYKNHLGRIGLVKISEILKPKLCIISEFGEEVSNFRIGIAKIFTKAFNEEIVFLPADIGLEYDFIQKKINAITNLDVENATVGESMIEAKEVGICQLRKDYSLHYFRNGNYFSESDLIQVLIEKYDKSVK